MKKRTVLKIRTVTMEVPAWFTELGANRDTDLAGKYGIPPAFVSGVRRAMGIPSYNKIHKNLKSDGERWKHVHRLKRYKIPKSKWPEILGFEPMYGLTAMELLDEFIYCRKNRFRYNALVPKLPRLKGKSDPYIKAQVAVRPVRQPKTPEEGLLEKDDESFGVGDTD